MSSAFGSEEPGGQQPTNEESSPPPKTPDTDAVPDSGLLDEVLEETLSLSPNRGIGQEELNVLLNVAKRHRGQQLSLAPVAVDLVQSILRFRFANLKIDASKWEEMSAQIAGTLMEDEQSCQRLEKFWGRLGEALP